MNQNPDIAHALTDRELAALEKRIAEEYRKAAEELQAKIDAYFERFKARDAEKLKLLQDGKITEQEYMQWRLAQIGRGERFEALRDRMAERYTAANEVTAAYINDTTPGIYSLNRNYAAYTIEQQTGGNVAFDLWDEQTVRRLIVERPDLMPYYPPEKAVNLGIDLAWGKKQITAQVTSGILQGESIPKIAKRLQTNIPDMERVSAVRAARTAVTGAQNAGRQDSYIRAEEMGIELEREWVATLDNRTRHYHAKADGQTAAVDKPFIVGGEEIMFPGDTSSGASGWNIYNCRCRTIGKVKGVDMSDAKRRVRDPETGKNVVIKDVTYSEWESMKKGKPAKPEKEKEAKPDYQMNAEKAIENLYTARREKYDLKTVSIEEWKDSPLYEKMVSFNGLDENLQRDITEQIEALSGKYYSSVQAIKVGDKKEFFGTREFASTKQITATASSEIVFNPFKINDIERIKELSDKGWSVKIKQGDEGKYVITHEFAHSIINLDSVKEKNFVGYDTKPAQKAAKEIKSIFTEYESEVKAAQSALKKYELGYIMGDASAAQGYTEAKKTLEGVKISDYSLANANEFMAECFTQYEIGVGENKYAEEIVAIIMKYFGR